MLKKVVHSDLLSPHRTTGPRIMTSLFRLPGHFPPFIGSQSSSSLSSPYHILSFAALSTSKVTPTTAICRYAVPPAPGTLQSTRASRTGNTCERARPHNEYFLIDK